MQSCICLISKRLFAIIKDYLTIFQFLLFFTDSYIIKNSILDVDHTSDFVKAVYVRVRFGTIRSEPQLQLERIRLPKASLIRQN